MTNVSLMRINCKRKMIPFVLLEEIILWVNPNKPIEPELVSNLKHIGEQIPLYKKITLGDIEIDGRTTFTYNDICEDAHIVFGDYGNIININIIVIPECNKYTKQTYHFKINVPLSNSESIYINYNEINQIGIDDLLSLKEFPLLEKNNIIMFENPIFNDIQLFSDEIKIILDVQVLDYNENKKQVEAKRIKNINKERIQKGLYKIDLIHAYNANGVVEQLYTKKLEKKNYYTVCYNYEFIKQRGNIIQNGIIKNFKNNQMFLILENDINKIDRDLPPLYKDIYLDISMLHH